MIKQIVNKELYQNWHNRLKNDRTPVDEDDPQCGFYRMRGVKDGPWLPVAVWCVQEFEGDQAVGDQYLVATLNGKPIDPYKSWLWFKPITEEKFNRMTNPEEEPIGIMQNKPPVEAQDLNEAAPLF